MRQPHRETVVVIHDEAPLVRRANQVQIDAWKRANEEEQRFYEVTGKCGKSAMVFYSPEELATLDAYDRLAKHYMEKLGLKVFPIFVEPVPFYGNDLYQGDENFHVYRHENRSALSVSELEDLLLEQVRIKRKGEILFVFDRTHYTRLSDNMTKGLITDILRQELKFGNASALANSILALLQTDRRILGNPEDSSRWLPVRNGVIDLESFQLRPADPRRFLTDYRDVEWQGPLQYPLFHRFLMDISSGDGELYTRILEVVGYLLSPDHRAKRFVLFQGVGNSGKSVLALLIQSFFTPDDVSSLSVHQYGERFALSAVVDRSINVSMDLPNGVFDGRAVAVIKQITGQDTLSIEAKNRQPYSDKIRCKLLFGTNHPVELKVKDAAFAQRILLVPFYVAVPENKMDHNLLDKLRQEKSAIFYYALAAYREVVQRNYRFTGEERFGFRLENIQLPAQPSNSIPYFVAQCCRLDPEAFTSTEVLHVAFNAFCREVNSPPILDRSAFSRALKSHLEGQIEPLKKRVNGIPLNGYTGIKLNQ